MVCDHGRMPTLDPRVDAYLANATDFAQPILAELRSRVHKACPEVTETIKWGMPTFTYHGILAGLSSFKQHCGFGLWKNDLVINRIPELKDAISGLSRITTLRDLPNQREFARILKTAMQLNVEGIKSPRGATSKSAIAMHPDFAHALRNNPTAKKNLDGFSPSHRREYLEWIASAKRDTTRNSRIAQAVEWLTAGKHRNWKYER